jgi:hypothetical protein
MHGGSALERDGAHVRVDVSVRLEPRTGGYGCPDGQFYLSTITQAISGMSAKTPKDDPATRYCDEREAYSAGRMDTFVASWRSNFGSHCFSHAEGSGTRRGRRRTRTLQLTRPSVAALPQDLAAERQSLYRLISTRVGPRRWGALPDSCSGTSSP